jgi:hypothetical protein
MRFLHMLLCGALVEQAAHVEAATFSGYLNDSGNTALVYSDLTAALFGDDNEIANNVALHAFTVGAPGTFTFDSNGFASGGVDPYFTLFSGTGGTAAFLASNYDQAFATGGDFLISLVLAAGDYTIALGAFANMSMAENSPDSDPTLGDGFTFLGGPGFLGNYYYEVDVDAGTPTPVPEPATWWLFGLGLIGVRVCSRRSDNSWHGQSETHI